MAQQRNPFQEGIYAGLGLALRTKERIEDFAKKITQEHQMNEEEGKRFLDDLVKQSEETKTRLDEVIEKRLETYIADAGLPTKADIEKLTRKITELEKKLDQK
jgi:polyhydroxyalkanoate synthesis regulator phasin